MLAPKDVQLSRMGGQHHSHAWETQLGLHICGLLWFKQGESKGWVSFTHTDLLVDNMARHHQLSFMDGYDRYNQIKILKKIKNHFHRSMEHILI